MRGKLLKISGKNLTFQDSYGRNITIAVEKDHMTFLDTAIENVGKVFDVTTIEGKIIAMSLVA